MEISEPSWAQDEPVVATQILAAEESPARKKLMRLPNLNQSEPSSAAITYLNVLKEAAVVFSADGSLKIFSNGTFIREFEFDMKPSSVCTFNNYAVLFQRNQLLLIDLISGTSKNYDNMLGKVVFSKQINEREIVTASFENLQILDVQENRVSTDFRARVSCKFYAANSQFIACGDELKIQIFSIKSKKQFVFQVKAQLSCVQLYDNLLFLGDKCGFVQIYQIDDIAFSSKELKLVKEFKNLKEPIRTIAVSEKFCFFNAGSEFRIVEMSKLQCLDLQYFKIIAWQCCIFDDQLAIGKPDGSVWLCKIE